MIKKELPDDWIFRKINRTLKDEELAFKKQDRIRKSLSFVKKKARLSYKPIANLRSIGAEKIDLKDCTCNFTKLL